MKEKKYYSIGQVSNICKIPIKTLRYYDEIKVLIPNVRKETSNYRYYSKEQLITAFLIRQLRLLEFNLKDIKEIINDNQLDSQISGLEKRLVEIDEQMVYLQKKQKENQLLLNRLKEGNVYLSGEQEEDNKNTFKVESIPKIALLGKRSLIKSYHNEEVNLEHWIEISENAIQQDLEIEGSIYVTFHTDLFGQFFSKDCDIEFAVQVEESSLGVHKEVHEFGGFLAATAVYCGNYADIFKTYIALKRWIDENNYEVCGTVTEQFLISPIDTRNENEHVTKIIVPVKSTK